VTVPRQARLDFPGAVHHVMARGVARGRIFDDHSDRVFFIELLGRLVEESGAQCLAWALLPNHFHMFVRTGKRPLKWVMQRVLLRHAMRYNERHRRSGHLFQNRYKSILVQEDAYLRELVRYVHLNPLRAGVVRSLEGLERYPWCGHGALLGKVRARWQAVREVLALFGDRPPEARKAYAEYVAEGRGMGHQEEFAVGGLLRSVRRVEGAGGVVRKRRLVSGDERILGSGEYVAKVLRVVEQRARRKAGLKRRLTPSIVVKMAAEAAAAEERDVLGRNRQAKLVKARFLACKWLVDDLGTRVVDVAKVFKVTPPAVCHAVSKGRSVESEIGASM